MRLVTFAHHGHTRVGALVARAGRPYVVDLAQAAPGLPADMTGLLAAGEAALAAAGRAVAAAGPQQLLPEDDVTLLAPLPRPGKILCLGHNYYEHMGLGRTAPTEYPTIFCKTANTVIGPGQAIVIPRVTAQVDYEAELAVVIGRRARYVPEGQALACVAGYTIFNDVSARDYQKRTSQWMIGKSFDTFGPMGPALVTADEVPDPHALDLSLQLNGIEMQRANTRSLIFSIPYLVAYLSDVMTLEPGDVISTGTPARSPRPERSGGEGGGRSPEAQPEGPAAKNAPPFMQPGDEVRIRIQGLGELANPVLAE